MVIHMKRISIFLIMAVLIAGVVGCGGDQSTAIKIQDWYGLDAIRENLGGSYLLMNDLDSTTAGYEELASTTANGGNGWEPIGTSYNPFTGILDGQGYEIRNLSIDRPNRNYVGLFGYVGESGAIEDIGTANVNVTGYRYVGGLVGYNEGTVTNSYSIGSVIGAEHVGGLVGHDSGNTVSNSYYNHEESLINGENMITTGALSDEDFEEWLANSKFLDIDERLSQEDGYYLIQSVSDFKELLAFGQNATLKFRLTNDLDLGSEPNFYIPYLAGEFDGNGHIISNLSLNLDVVSVLGLFGCLIQGGTITEVGVENANIVGDILVGGLVANSRGTVSDSYVNGNVTGRMAVGGLMGRNEGIVSNSSFTGSVTGSRFVGGLAGNNAPGGTVDNSYANGNVTGKGRYMLGGLVAYNNQAAVSNSHFDGNVIGEGEILFVGGLVGRNSGGDVSDSYSTGSVTGWAAVGGLAGDNCYSGTVNNSHSTSNVISYANAGGLVGQNYLHADVSNSYSIGKVIGYANAGGLVGVNADESTVSNSFWDTETSGQSTSGGGTGKNTTDMKDIATFSNVGWNIIAVANPSIRNPSYIWNVVDGETYPFLSWQSNVPFYSEGSDKFQLYITSADGGEVTEPGKGVLSYDEGTVVNLVAEANEGSYFINWNGDVATIANVNAATTTITMNDSYFICANFGGVEICDWYDLDSIRDNLHGYYILMNDLDSTTPGYEELASPTANEGKGWKPIGSLGLRFSGILDGQGHEIRDLFVNRPINDDGGVGLLQWVSVEGRIKNVCLINVTMTGSHYVGGLVSYNEGTVDKSCSTGSVTGYGIVGGLVGENWGDVNNSYSTASVTGDDFCVGGLAGNNAPGGLFFNCYATGNVIGYSHVGGLLGENLAVVTNAYSTGSVLGEEHVGGLVGTNVGLATVSNSFWDTETSGQFNSEGGTGKTTTEMKSITTFLGATWHIIAVANPSIRNHDYFWNIVDDETYPFLSWQPVS